MAKDMAKENKYDNVFSTTIKPVAGFTLYQGAEKPKEPSIEELLEEAEKAEIRDVRKEEVLKKMRARAADIGKADKTPTAQPNPKRYLVDPATGKIDIDEEEGEYTYKDALLVSASIKGKGGQADDIIKIVNAVRGWGGQTDKKSYVVQQGEEGAVVQEVEPNKPLILNAPASNKPPVTYFVDNQGNVKQAQPGEPVVLGQPIQSKSFIEQVTDFAGAIGSLKEAGPMLRSILGVPESSGNTPAGVPVQVTGPDGKPFVMDLGQIINWKKFEGEERRADEQQHAITGLAQAVRENIPDGIQALLKTVEEVKGGAGAKTPAPGGQEQPQQTFKCGDCGTEFGPPAGWAGQPLKCPNPQCGREYTKEELLR
ncbi:hypothetical protein ES708_00021 [subsurface metagenome]